MIYLIVCPGVRLNWAFIHRYYKKIWTDLQLIRPPKIVRIPDIVTVEESQHLFMVITILTRGGLRFMTNGYVPFTNNAAGNSIRITKVQQKI
jgi:hypothetical protein